MSKQTKGAVLIADGLADRPMPALDGTTPLEVADTPNLDQIAAEGQCGLMDPIGPGVRAGSDTSHPAIPGYDPSAVYTGRGPFEAIGIGLEVCGGDICFRCDFSTLEGELELGADGHFRGAVQMFDRLAGYVREHGPADLHLTITCDHCTPISFGDHTGDPVPLAVCGPNLCHDSVRAFGERAVVGGALGRIRGLEVMSIMTNLMGVQEKFGA